MLYPGCRKKVMLAAAKHADLGGGEMPKLKLFNWIFLLEQNWLELDVFTEAKLVRTVNVYWSNAGQNWIYVLKQKWLELDMFTETKLVRIGHVY